ncbi:hypothetical protein SO802_016805 [Lithocarpus litseifolius]|uniref:RNase H type-1 domain-containing protein n=1 Tax=Lithocarpus litseifolius TaxID=425828 RepID=A0AAW2D015_9ROSI
MLGLDEESVKDFQLYATILCDHLWMARNKARMEGSKSDPTDLSKQILRVFMEHKEAWKEQNERPSKDVVWSPPPRSWIKINFDAAICEEKTTVAVVERDTTDNLFLAWSEQFESENSLLGEAKAAWYVIRCAVNEGFQNKILEGDVWNVTEPLKKSDVAPHWSIRSILEDILFFANCFSNVEFLLSIEKGNVSAHLLAQWTALVNWSGLVPISNLPSHVFQAFVRDGPRPDLFISPLFQVEFFEQ